MLFVLGPNTVSCPFFVKKKVALEHSHAHMFTYCLWLLSHYKSRIEQFGQRPYDLQCLKYLPSDSLQEKFFDYWYTEVSRKLLIYKQNRGSLELETT